MQTIAVSDLRANLMKVLKQIEKGSSIMITSRGKAVAQLVPANNSLKQAENKIKQLRKTAVIHDILGPIEEVWKADRE